MTQVGVVVGLGRIIGGRDDILQNASVRILF